MVVAAKKGCHKKIKTIYDIFFTPSPQKKNSLEELLLHLPKNWITTNYSQAKSKLWPNISKLLTNCEKASQQQHQQDSIILSFFSSFWMPLCILTININSIIPIIAIFIINHPYHHCIPLSWLSSLSSFITSRKSRVRRENWRKSVPLFRMYVPFTWKSPL